MQVQPGGGSRAFGVSVGDGARDGGVFGGTLRQALIVSASEAPHAREVHARARDRRRKVGATAEGLVESRVELGDEGVVAVALRVIGGEHGRVDCGEACGEFSKAAPRCIPRSVAPSPSVSTQPATVRDAARGDTGGLLVEGGAQLEEGGDVVGLDLAHDKSAGPTFGREPGSGESCKGFAHRSTTDPEPARLLDFGERGAGGELAFDNRRPEGVERAIGSSAHTDNVYIVASWR